MKKYLLATALLSIFSFASTHAQTLIDVQFGGNEYGPPAAVQTGVGLIGSSGDIWNNYTSTSALESGVNLYDTTGAFSGATLILTGSGLYQYSNGVNPGDPYGGNQLSSNGSSVGNLASGELGANPSLTLSLAGLSANTTYSVYLLSSPDRWERSSSWSVNGGTSQTVGPLNSYTGPYTNNGSGWAPYEPVLGINYLVLSGTTDGLGKLTLAGTSVAGDVDINGFQLQAQAAPEPSTWALLMAGVVGLFALRRKRWTAV